MIASPMQGGGAARGKPGRPRDTRIDAAIAAHPNQSNRRIAQLLGCTETAVRKRRAEGISSHVSTCPCRGCELVRTPPPRRPVMRYHGGKWRLARWIISHFPAHRTYTEAFGGAASVLLNKPRCYAEVYNDLDSDLVALFRVLADQEAAAELERRVRLIPFSREMFAAAYVESEQEMDVDVACRVLTRAAMGFGSAAACRKQKTGFRGNVTRSGTTPAADWASYPDQLIAFTARLSGVVIESRPAIQVVQTYDGPDALHYVDPPYPHGTRHFKARESGQVYRHEMTDNDHRDLATALRACRGMVILSGYACDLYDRELYPDWARVERETHADGAKDRTEVLWLNPAAAAVSPALRTTSPTPSLFDLDDAPARAEVA